MRTKRCSSDHSSPTKRTMTANVSPSQEVPSKMNDRYMYFPVISLWRRASSYKINGTRSNVSSVSKTISIFLENIHKSIKFRERNACPKKRCDHFNTIDLLLFRQALTAQMLFLIVLCQSHNNIMFMSLFLFPLHLAVHVFL